MSRSFSAGPHAIGYLYQARYALLLILESSDECEMSIEGLDDVSCDESGNLSLAQLKHHMDRQASLTDSSTDLWKTIRIWSTYISSRTIDITTVSLTLITTAVAHENSVAYFLRPGNERNTQEAIQKLRNIAQTSKNDKLSKSFQAFQDLQSFEQEALVQAISVLDESPQIEDTTSKIKKELRRAVRREHLDALYERVEGWWFDKVVRHLNDGSNAPIPKLEVEDKVRSIAEQFHPDALPIDFFGVAPPNLPNPDTDTRQFVTQLKEIAINNKRIEKAIIDYYRAFEQRSRWAREDLLLSDELELYEQKLIDEWERQQLMLLDDCDASDEESCQSLGRNLYNWMERDANIPIRSRVTEPYVMRGSYHMLADRTPPSIYWHPQFLNRLQTLLVGNVE